MKQKVIMLLKKLKQVNGQGLVDYVFILSFVALVVITVLGFIGQKLKDVIQAVVNGFSLVP